MKHTLLLTIATLALAVSPLSAGPTETLHELFESYDRWYLQQYPADAMHRGDYSNADRIREVSIASHERRHADRRLFQQRVQAIDWTALSESDLVNAELFDLMIGRSIDGHEFRTFLAPIGSRSGPHQSIPQMGDHVRFDTVLHYEQYLSRLEQVPTMIDDTIECMAVGLRESRVPPRVTLEGVPGQFEALIEGGGLDRLRDPFTKTPPHIDAATRASLVERFESVSLPAVKQAMSKLHRFIVVVYLPGCRDSIAATDWPNGHDYYAHQLRVMTTLRMSPDEIFYIGKREVDNIRSEMMNVIRRSDFMDSYPDARELGAEALFKAFVSYLRTDARFYYTSADDLLDGYKAICKTIDGHMPELFGNLPRQPYGVVPIPEFMAAHQTTAYYRGGDLRNAEAGFFYANTYDLSQRPRYDMIALALHEAVPGHHHQIALARELENIPEFRKDTWFTAFGEGWALYAEWLGIEMGLYEDPYDDFGRLGFEMWRACRLVVDPGMHAKGWSRQEAIDFMMKNTALSELNIVTEVDRYIGWPGQATAYKIGERRFSRLRHMAEHQLGERFDVRSFHDMLLSAGSIPLEVMERRANEWIEASKGP